MREPRKKPKPAAATGAWKPRVFFWVLTAGLLALGIAELLNTLHRPSLQRINGAKGSPALAVYQKGRAQHREMWLFHEPEGEEGPPVCFQHIAVSDPDDPTGEIRWSYTGEYLYATRRKADTIEPRPLWAYHFQERVLYALDDEAAKAGLPVRVASEMEITELVNRRGGGRGVPAMAWYDFGKAGEHLPAWKATRWEHHLPKR